MLLRISDERPDNEIRQAVDVAVTEAASEFSPLKFEGEYPTSGFGISEIRPRHVGIAADYWQATITTSYADWINTTVSDNAYLVVTGIFNNTLQPQTSELSPSANGNDMPRVNIEQMYTFDMAKAWLPKPFVVKANGNITIQAIAKQGQTEQIGLLGYTIAKRSYLIAATPT